MDKDIVADYGNLYRAYKEAKSGKKFNSSTARFSNVALDGINILKEQLEIRHTQMLHIKVRKNPTETKNKIILIHKRKRNIYITDF